MIDVKGFARLMSTYQTGFEQEVKLPCWGIRDAHLAMLFMLFCNRRTVTRAVATDKDQKDQEDHVTTTTTLSMSVFEFVVVFQWLGAPTLELSESIAPPHLIIEHIFLQHFEAPHTGAEDVTSWVPLPCANYKGVMSRTQSESHLLTSRWAKFLNRLCEGRVEIDHDKTVTFYHRNLVMSMFENESKIGGSEEQCLTHSLQYKYDSKQENGGKVEDWAALQRSKYRRRGKTVDARVESHEKRKLNAIQNRRFKIPYSPLPPRVVNLDGIT